MILTLPWPPTELSPNRRLHWAPLAKAKAAYRLACATAARQQGATKFNAAALTVHMTFVPPDRRSYDVDNMLARMKAGIDGLADVFEVDDKHWTYQLPPIAPDVGGFVRVAVSAAQQGPA